MEGKRDISWKEVSLPGQLKDQLRNSANTLRIVGWTNGSLNHFMARS
jgi:hypothetical protein